ncbi:MAG: CTP synthase [Ruminococcaceae bacterium]|nr:CTP synthase [Oscillospiraceae bacterium]
MRKYIFVSGGAVSDFGKTALSASIGLLLSKRGFDVVNKKLNPCMNMSVSSLEPSSFGEIFVTSDGSESDSSLGFYERFTCRKTDKSCFMTAGNIYWSIINKERIGSFHGETVTVSSHVAEEIKDFICSGTGDIVITEVGGTAGGIESAHFLDAVGKIKEIAEKENVMYVHVENIPSLVASEEEKLEAVNRSMALLLERGIQPDAIVCRTEKELSESLIDKISIFSNLNKDAVIEWQTADLLYDIPLVLEKSGLSDLILKRLSLRDFKPKLEKWKNLVSKAKKAEKEVKIAVVGKSASLKSAYQSVKEALECASYEHGAKAVIQWIDSNNLNEKNVSEVLAPCSGIVIPDGKEKKGTDGIKIAANYARENDVPLLAIGQGMHMAVAGVASDVLGINETHRGENCGEDVGVLVERDLRYGEEKIKIIRGTKTFSAYGRELFYERCRHKYMINDAYKEKLEEVGLYFTGTSAEDGICEIVEMPKNRFFIGVQFNPEFSSMPENVHPLFMEFIRESLS